MPKPTLLICSGSRCRKALRKDDRLQRAVAQLPVEVQWVGCQKVCNGPVVGLAVEGRWEWFERVNSRKAIRALSVLLEEDLLEKPLRKRRNARRAGKRRS